MLYIKEFIDTKIFADAKSIPLDEIDSPGMEEREYYYPHGRPVSMMKTTKRAIQKRGETSNGVGKRQ